MTWTAMEITPSLLRSTWVILPTCFRAFRKHDMIKTKKSWDHCIRTSFAQLLKCTCTDKTSFCYCSMEMCWPGEHLRKEQINGANSYNLSCVLLNATQAIHTCCWGWVGWGASQHCTSVPMTMSSSPADMIKEGINDCVGNETFMCHVSRKPSPERAEAAAETGAHTVPRLGQTTGDYQPFSRKAQHASVWTCANDPLRSRVSSEIINAS